MTRFELASGVGNDHFAKCDTATAQFYPKLVTHLVIEKSFVI